MSQLVLSFQAAEVTCCLFSYDWTTAMNFQQAGKENILFHFCNHYTTFVTFVLYNFITFLIIIKDDDDSNVLLMVY